ncbi:MAG: pantothenate synthase [Pleopsidium flavum]|nr:MAG: pantothenate synthase [Pleopsidium flavum]
MSSPIKVFRDVAPLRDFRRRLIYDHEGVGLVPTMGALHDGHLSLIRQAAEENSGVVVSIYVNPTQFGLNEDLDSYPKTWERDMQLLTELNKELDAGSARGRIKAIFAPTTKTMYPTLPPTSDPAGHGSFVTITPLATQLEGASRPVFFRGVATVCMKLFSIIMPERVYFGQKDIQQTVVIRRMVKDFHLHTEVRVGPTVREADGLAMSSRNVYLGDRRRKVAIVLRRTLKAAEQQYASGKRRKADILQPAIELAHSVATEQARLSPRETALFEVDYISLADPDTLEEMDEVDVSRGAILSGAIKMQPIEDSGDDEDCGLGGGVSTVRLIDNIILDRVQ